MTKLDEISRTAGVDVSIDPDPTLRLTASPAQALIEEARRRQRRRHRWTAASLAVMLAAGVLIGVAMGDGGGPPTSLATPSPRTPASPTIASTTTTSTTTTTTTTPTTTSSLASPAATPAAAGGPASAVTASAPAPTGPPIDTNVKVYGDCQTPTIEPTEMILTCADAGVRIEGLHWTSWTNVSASAIGTLVYNDCTPTCAGGQFHYVPNAQVTLSVPVVGAAGQVVWSMVQENPEPPGYATGPYQGGPQPLVTQPD
jgi:hypothetical protein